MEGHDLVVTVKAPNLFVEPSFDYKTQTWVWIPLSETFKIHRKYYNKNK